MRALQRRHPEEPPVRGLDALLAPATSFPTQAGPLVIRRLGLRDMAAATAVLELAMTYAFHARRRLLPFQEAGWDTSLLGTFVALCHEASLAIPDGPLEWLDSILEHPGGAPVSAGFSADPELFAVSDMPALVWALGAHPDIASFVWFMAPEKSSQETRVSKAREHFYPGDVDTWERLMDAVQQRYTWVTDEILVAMPVARLMQLWRVSVKQQLEEYKQYLEGVAWDSYWTYWGTPLEAGQSHMDYKAWKAQLGLGKLLRRDPKFHSLAEEATDIVSRTLAKFRKYKFVAPKSAEGASPEGPKTRIQVTEAREQQQPAPLKPQRKQAVPGSKKTRVQVAAERGVR